MNIKELRELDVKHMWHPYTDMAKFETLEFPVIEKAEGIFLYTVEGKKLYDGIASWWCVNLGHSHPDLLKAMHNQINTLQHCITGGASHPSAIFLSQKISEITPGNLNHVYYCSDGSSSVEAALKIAIQYRYNIGQKQKYKFISLQDGYHGDTLGSVSVGYVDHFHHMFKPVLMQNYQAQSPNCADCPYNKEPESCSTECFNSMKETIENHHQETTAVIVEPLCQGAGGIRLYPEEYLRKLRAMCDKYNLLLICDEIAVGFGRMGKWFACEVAGIIPDIMVIGKGLTGGYLPMSAAVATDKIYNAFKGKEGKVNTFFHGHTFCGNPVTSSLACAAIDTYIKGDVINKTKPLIKQLKEGFKKMEQYFNNSKSFSKGLIAKIDISDNDGGSQKAFDITQSAIKNGLMIRPLGRTIYFWPPLITTKKQLEKMLEILEVSIKSNI